MFADASGCVTSAVIEFIKSTVIKSTATPSPSVAVLGETKLAGPPAGSVLSYAILNPPIFSDLIALVTAQVTVCFYLVFRLVNLMVILLFLLFWCVLGAYDYELSSLSSVSATTDSDTSLSLTPTVVPISLIAV